MLSPYWTGTLLKQDSNLTNGRRFYCLTIDNGFKKADIPERGTVKLPFKKKLDVQLDFLIWGKQFPLHNFTGQLFPILEGKPCAALLIGKYMKFLTNQE